MPTTLYTSYIQETIGLTGPDYCNCILEIAPNYVRAAFETVTITLNANSPKVMTGATGATFGGVAGTDFTVTGTRTATVKVPAGTSGAQVDVVVTLSDGSTVTAQKGLWYSDEAARNNFRETVSGDPVTPDGSLIVAGVTLKHKDTDYVGSAISDPPPSPDAPVISAISYGRGRIKIYIGMTPWTEEYDVYRNDVLIPEGEGITENFFVDEGLADGEYDYKVVAKNTAGSTTSNVVSNVPSYLTDQEQNIWDTFQSVFTAHFDASDFTTFVYSHQDHLAQDSATGYPSLMVYPVKVSDGTTMTFRIAIHMRGWDTGSNYVTELLVEQLEKVTAALAEILSEEAGLISAVRATDPRLGSFQQSIIEAYQELTVSLVEA